MQGGQQFIRVATVVFAVTFLMTLLTDGRTSAHADSVHAGPSPAPSLQSAQLQSAQMASSLSSWAMSLYSMTRVQGQDLGQEPTISGDLVPWKNESAAQSNTLWSELGRLFADRVTDRVTEKVNEWADGRWRMVNGWTTYEWRARPGASVSFWLGSGANRLRTFFSPDGIDRSIIRPTRRPTGRDAKAEELKMLGRVDFGVLAVPPVVGKKSSGYGYRIHPITKRRKFHKGVDYGARRGTRVQAAGPGIVTVARRRGTYGKLVVISHGLGLETRYAHLHKIKVEEGQFVPAGTLIGLVGSTGRSTGPHLHFEVRQYGDPVDPHWAMARSSESITDELVGELVGVLNWSSTSERRSDKLVARKH